MNTVMKSYLINFLHPFKFAHFISGHNEHVDVNDFEQWRNEGMRPLDSWQAISLSWAFKILQASMLLIFLMLGPSLRDFHPSLFVKASSEVWVVFLGLGVIFFPLRVGFSLILWKFMLRFILLLFLEEDEIEGKLDEVLAHSFTSYTILAVPVAGALLHEILWAVYLYAGLRNVYGLSSMQALSVFSAFTTLILLLVSSFFMGMFTIFSLL